MASTSFLFSSSILLLSLLVIASAADYSYSPTPETVKPQPNNVYTSTPIPSSDDLKPRDGYSPKPAPENTKPDYGYGPKPKSLDLKFKSQVNVEYVPKPETPKKQMPTEYVSKPELTIPKKPTDQYVPKPELETPKIPIDKYVPKPELETPKTSSDKYAPKKPNGGYVPKPEVPLPIGIEGLVLCKSGSKYTPIKGAVARITCSILGHKGYEAAPFSCLTSATDAKGFFYKTLSDLGVNQILQLTDCRVKLEKSPLENCNIPTNVNKGITGALLSSYQILHDRKIKLYPVGPFFYTSASDHQSPTPTAY
ncbi:proline-rich protein 3-like [Euphorbia lathyris]|uniref:proline-rich protein 3-like n=1 Tax=Euphorbia lathyris TaxID=212925 RepID=UPI003313A752